MRAPTTTRSAGFFIVMKKIHILVLILLVAGVATSAWYTKRPAATITYGSQAVVFPVGAEGENYADQTSVSESATPVSNAVAPNTGEEKKGAEPTKESTCETLRIVVESAAYSACAAAEMTVLAAMHIATSEGLTFSGREYPSLGFYIESINGKKAENGYYWFLYINGISSTEGASAAHVQAGETVEWLYKKSY